jgi:hypothetical protein
MYYVRSAFAKSSVDNCPGLDANAPIRIDRRDAQV